MGNLAHALTAWSAKEAAGYLGVRAAKRRR
jgi:hypothetical protein